MKKQIFQVVLVAVVSALLIFAGCASPRKRALKSTISLYEKSYDQVWNAVNEFLLDDMNCSIDSEDKASGKIETGWVHTMDMDGYNKWKIIARIEKKKNGVYVFLDKMEQVKNIPRTSMGMTSEQGRNNRDRNTPDSFNWRTLEVNKTEIEGFQNQIRIKLNK
jgi:uncharacterized lipoprotein